jgi:hypothetical protein
MHKSRIEEARKEMIAKEGGDELRRSQGEHRNSQRHKAKTTPLHSTHWLLCGCADSNVEEEEERAIGTGKREEKK